MNPLIIALEGIAAALGHEVNMAKLAEVVAAAEAANFPCDPIPAILDHKDEIFTDPNFRGALAAVLGYLDLLLQHAPTKPPAPAPVNPPV